MGDNQHICKQRPYAFSIQVESGLLGCDIMKLGEQFLTFLRHYICLSHSQWPHGLRCRSVAACVLRLWDQIPPEAGMFVCWACCVLSDRGLCDELITHSQESYWLWCVVVCDLETTWIRRLWPTGGCCAKKKHIIINDRDSLTQQPCDLMYV
jgi:hypothetical protein